MNVPRNDIDLLIRDKYGGALTLAAIRRLAEDIARLAHGEHIAYVIGWAPFLGVKVDLSQKPLIPRPETEFWTEQVVKEMLYPGTASTHYALRTTNPLRILDAFCGSGCIGLAVLKHVPQAQVTFADIESRYFKGIRKSARLNGIPTRHLRTTFSNVLTAPVRSSGERRRENIGIYDYILANPPYIPSGRKLSASLKQEPQRALFGGKDGLRYVRALMRQAPQHLAPGGKLVMEFDSGQKRTVGVLARQLGYEAKFCKDQYGKWRYVILTERRNTKTTALRWSLYPAT